MKHRGRVVGWVLVTLLLIPSVAVASWQAGGSGSGANDADALPAGATPSLSATGRNVQVDWTGATFQDGTPAGGYTVARYDAGSGSPDTILSACGGTLAGLTCTEAAVPPGTWKYAITPVHGADWSGSEGSMSTSVTIAPPVFAFDSTTAITSLPSTRTGTLAQFATGESVTFHMSAPTGPSLTGSHSVIGAAGTATTSTTIPAGTADGVYDVYAVGSLGSEDASQVTVDRTAPVVTAAVIQKSAGGTAGFIARDVAFYVYASITDGVTGVASATTDVSSVTGVAGASALSAGSWTIAGTTYTHRSALLTASATLTSGAKSFAISATDVAGNAGTTSGFSVTADIAAPSGSDIQITNGGATVGKPETGDVVTFTFSETMDAESILSGWDGTGTAVRVRVVQAGGSDRVEVWDAAGSAILPLGSVRLNRTDFVTVTADFTGSSMTMSGSTVQIVLGSPTGATTTAAGTATLRWTPAAGATDRAGNACGTANRNETGAADIDF